MLRIKFTKSEQRVQSNSKRKRILYAVLAWIWGIVLALGVVFVGVVLFLGHGKRNLRKNVGDDVPVLVVEDAIEQENGQQDIATWQEGWVRYHGKIYEYNEDILTFLVLGIDKDGKVKPAENRTDGGQSDANFLLVANPETKELSIVGINRDTMVEITMVGMGENGEDIKTMAELAVQHGFGDGLEQSCELTRAVVSELFCGLPIHGYLSFNEDGIGELNDALGGVDVTVLEDMTKLNKSWTEGTRVHLDGAEASDYVHWRDTTVFESARGRLARQKQYLSTFAKKAIEGTKKDLTLPLNLYQSFAPYIVTDISADEISYLASELPHYHFSGDAVYTLEGETKMGEQFEEFYPDKEALRDLMIKVFYREVVSEDGQEL